MGIPFIGGSKFTSIFRASRYVHQRRLIATGRYERASRGEASARPRDRHRSLHEGTLIDSCDLQENIHLALVTQNWST